MLAGGLGASFQAAAQVTLYEPRGRFQLNVEQIAFRRDLRSRYREHYSILGVGSGEEALTTVRELKSRGATVLMATHQLERGANLADLAIFLEQGRVEWFGSAEEALQRALDEAGDDQAHPRRRRRHFA